MSARDLEGLNDRVLQPGRRAIDQIKSMKNQTIYMPEGGSFLFVMTMGNVAIVRIKNPMNHDRIKRDNRRRYRTWFDLVECSSNIIRVLFSLKISLGIENVFRVYDLCKFICMCVLIDKKKTVVLQC